MEVTQEVQDLIRKHLSAQVGETLQGELADLERLRKRDKQTTEQLDSKRATIDSMTVSLDVANARLAKHEALDKRLEEIEKRERNHELSIMKAQLENERSNNLRLFELVGVIFRNPVVTETLSTSINRTEMHPTQGYQQSLPSSECSTKTTQVTK